MTKQAVWVLGDQLAMNGPAVQFAKTNNAPVLMIEAMQEAKLVWSHKARIVVFLSAMRHFAQALKKQGLEVVYSNLKQTEQNSLTQQAQALCKQHQITHLVVVEPGEWRLENELLEFTHQQKIRLDILQDTHFYSNKADFKQWASRYKQLRMEYFYREMRKQHTVLMQGDKPVGGEWNFDKHNRKAFPKQGPGEIEPALSFKPDELTQQVIDEVEADFSDHPGQLSAFNWPVTADQAHQALTHFVKYRLPNFGDYQDAMWTDTPFVWHSLLSSSLNLHLLDPRQAVQAAQQAYETGNAPLTSVEGFIRQILGWREFIRGVYWLDMPGYRDANFFKAERNLPKWFWTGQTDMTCMQQSIGQTLETGYAHHIQRLMIIGNFSNLAGLSPKQVEDWFLAVYIDAVEWVELPNVAGMALFADGGRFASKPYIAGGAYVNRMSNYCKNCKYKFSNKTGEDACPFSTLYWYFIEQNQTWLKKNSRTTLMVKNFERLKQTEQYAIQTRAKWVLKNINSL